MRLGAAAAGAGGTADLRSDANWSNGLMSITP